MKNTRDIPRGMIWIGISSAIFGLLPSLYKSDRVVYTLDLSWPWLLTLTLHIYTATVAFSVEYSLWDITCIFHREEGGGSIQCILCVI